jgi:hypothetical protein
MGLKPFSIAPVVVAVVSEAGEDGVSDPVLRSVWLRMSSAKLLAHLTIVGSPDPGSPGVGFASTSTWQLTPHVQAAEALNSRPAPLHHVFRTADGTEVPQPLPGGYEICSAVRLWRARLTLVPGAFVFVDDEGNTISTDGFGRIVAACTLEPAPEACLTQKEFEELAQLCELWVDGAPAELEL